MILYVSLGVSMGTIALFVTIVIIVLLGTSVPSPDPNYYTESSHLLLYNAFQVRTYSEDVKAKTLALSRANYSYYSGFQCTFVISFLRCDQTSSDHGRRKFFSRGQQWIFPGVNQKHFSSEQQWLNIILPTQN